MDGIKNMKSSCSTILGEEKNQRKLSNGVPVFSEEFDYSFFEYFEQEKRVGRAVSNRLLAGEAVKLLKTLQLRNFVASTQYIRRWKNRFGVIIRQATNDSQRPHWGCKSCPLCIELVATAPRLHSVQHCERGPNHGPH